MEKDFVCTLCGGDDKKLGMRSSFLSEKQWKRIEPLLSRLRSRGRPWADNRAVLEGILSVLKSGPRWRDLPNQYPAASTCWRRLRQREEQEVWLKI